MLQWLNIEHNPTRWMQEIEWMIEASKNKSSNARILKIVYAETVYAYLMYRNKHVYRDRDSNINDSETNIGKSIIDTIVQRI